jgi:hypothetical protein
MARRGRVVARALGGGIAVQLAVSIWLAAGCSGNSTSGDGDGSAGADPAAEGGRGSGDPPGDGGNSETGEAGRADPGSGGTGSGGTSGQGGNGGVAGGGPIPCPVGQANICLNPQTLLGCNLDTGFIETVDCRQDVPEGLANLGCGVADNGAKACLLDFADPTCWLGAQIFSVCAGATTEDEVVSYYLGCFHDMNGAHTVIPCYIPYADEVTLTVDCEAADLACLPDIGAGGAGGEGGAGG